MALLTPQNQQQGFGSRLGSIFSPQKFNPGGILSGLNINMGTKAQGAGSSPTPQNNVLASKDQQKTSNVAGPQGTTTSSTQGINTNSPQKTNINSPKTAEIQNQLDTAQSSLKDLQAKQSALQKYGLNDASQLVRNSSGEYVPTNQVAATITNPYASKAAPYSGYVGSLGNVPNQYAPQYNQYAQGLTTAATNPNIQQAYQNIQDLQNQYAQATAQVGGTPGLGQQEAQGTQGLLQNLFANKMSAAQQALANAQTQAGLEQAGYQQAGALTQGQQGLQQSALQQAGAFAQPTTQFGILTSPITGQPVTGGGTQSLVDIAKQGGAIQGAIQNAQTATTAGVGAAQTAFNNAYQDYQNLQNSAQNIDQFGSLLLSGMTAPDGTQINPSNVKFGNETLASLRNQLSSGQQAQYDNTLASLRSRVSGLLASGGDQIPSQITSDANKILDGSLPYSQLSGVLQRIQDEAKILLQNKSQIVNQNWQQIQSGTTYGNTTGTTGATSTAPNPYH